MSRLAERSRALAPPAWTVLPRALWPVAAGLVIAAVVSSLIGENVGGFTSKVMLIAGINIILAVSLTVVNGFTGQFSMGHAGFMAVGGYVAAACLYYGSARWLATPDFAEAAIHSGVLSNGAETDLAGGRIEPDASGAALVLADPVTPRAGRSHRLRRADDAERRGPTIAIALPNPDYQAGARIPLASPRAAEWAGADVRLVLAPRWFTGTDALFLGSILFGGLVAAAAGYLVGLPSLRLRGDYLAIVTLGFGEIVRVVLQGTSDQIQPWKVQDAAAAPWYQLPIMLGGPKGFNLLPTYTSLFWVYFFVFLTLIVCYRLKTSSVGRAFLSIREDEIAAQAMGVNITKYKVRAFVLASFFAGLAGGLYAMDIGAINAGDLGFQKSFDVIIMVVLGGMGSISGAALAAVILTILPELLRNPPPVWPAGVVLLGIAAAVQWRRARWRPRTLIIIAVATSLLEGGRQYCLASGVSMADFRLLIYALALIVMMIVRPEGLLGLRELWELWRPRAAAPPAGGVS